MAASQQEPLVPPDEHPPQELLDKARRILENAPLYLDADNPDPLKGKYSVDQMLTLWHWYKNKMGQQLDSFEQVLKTPMEKEEEAELCSLKEQAKNPLAWKYKKLRDLELLQAANKLPPDQREEFLAHGYRTPAKPQAPPAPEEAASSPSPGAVSYSEESEWWDGWSNPRYEDMPNQRFLRSIVSAITEGRELLASKFGSDSAGVSYRPPTAEDPPAESINWEEERQKEALLWRALPPDLDPFIVQVQADQKNALLAGPSKPPPIDLQSEWHTHRGLFITTFASTLGVLTVRFALRWAWRAVRQRMAAAQEAKEKAAAEAAAAKPKARKGTGKTKKTAGSTSSTSTTKSRTKTRPT